MNVSDKTNINSRKNENISIYDCVYESEKGVVYLVGTHISFEEDVLGIKINVVNGWVLLEAKHL